jgi:hypothetical protein
LKVIVNGLTIRLGVKVVKSVALALRRNCQVEGVQFIDFFHFRLCEVVINCFFMFSNLLQKLNFFFSTLFLVVVKTF